MSSSLLQNTHNLFHYILHIYIYSILQENNKILIVMRQRMVTSVTIFYIMLIARDTFLFGTFVSHPDAMFRFS